MSQARRAAIASQYRAQLIMRETPTLAALSAAHTALLHTTAPALMTLFRAMHDAQQSGPLAPSWVHEQGRLASVTTVVMTATAHFATVAEHATRVLQQESVTLAHRAAQAQAQAAGLSALHAPTHAALETLATHTHAGTSLARLFSGMAEETARRVSEVLTRAATLNTKVTTTTTVAHEVTQALLTPLYRAITITKTSAVQAFRDALSAYFAANDETIIGWLWWCELSPRSCGACCALHATEHPLSEEMQSHACCHCTQILLLAGEKPLLQTGVEWFAEQDAATQRSVLGSEVMYQLYKAGTIDLSDVVGYHEDPLWGTSVYQKSAKELTTHA